MSMRLHTFRLDFSERRPGIPRRGVRFPFIADGRAVAGVSCALSLRAAGDMGYDPEAAGENPNRRRFFEALGIADGRLRARKQTHSRNVRFVDAFEAVLSPGDGLITKDPSVFLSVTVADCLPVFLLDMETGAFAALHSGWKGTGIAGAALEAMAARWGTRAESVAAVLGPCIRGCCYEVDAERAAAFEAEFGGDSGPFPLGPVVRRAGNKSYIDLQAANARLLAAAGVADLAVCEDCTFTEGRLGSFRREGSGHFTRMVAVVGRLSEEKD